MFDHITLPIKDFGKEKAFYEKALAPLGFTARVPGDATYCGFGIKQTNFWLGLIEDDNAAPAPMHIAFAGKDKKQVQDFYAAALAAGAKDNGAPGYHTEYGGGHYAAFVLDPEGNNIEVVFRDADKY